MKKVQPLNQFSNENGRAVLNPVNEDAFHQMIESTRLDLPARLAVGLELESALLERQSLSLHNFAPKVTRHRAAKSGSPALTRTCETRLHRK